MNNTCPISRMALCIAGMLTCTAVSLASEVAEEPASFWKPVERLHSQTINCDSDESESDSVGKVPSHNGPVVEFAIDEGSNATTVHGRVLVDAQDGGVLLEEASGRIRQVMPATMISRRLLDQTFQPLTADEMAVTLLTQTPTGFEVHQTDHYVICANSSEQYVEFVGKLLEKVFSEYFKFMAEQDIPVHRPIGKLPVIILQSPRDLQEFAARQHPETSFENTPGYYSIRENQTLMLDLTGDRGMRSASAIRKRLSEQPLQVATVVHEAVHQIAFNSGLQVRMADNPVWFSEGLALYFEPISPRASGLWTRPGLVNGRHHAEIQQSSGDGAVRIPFADLLQTDSAFLNDQTVATAYAESWALMTYLFRQHKEGVRRFAGILASRKPLQRVPPEQRLQEFRTAFGRSPDEMEKEVISLVRRLRAPK